MSRGPLIACPHCDTLHVRLDPGVRGRAECRCCGTVLYRRGWLSMEQWVALGWAGLAVFAIAQWFPIASLSLQGQDISLTYWQALHLCWDRGYYGVSVLTGLVGFWFPLLQIALTLWVMQAIAARRLPPDLGRTLRLLGHLAPWSMATVLILSILVSVVKVAGLARLQVEPGMLGFLALCFLLTGLSRWNARALWRQAEDAGLVPVSGAQGRGRVCDACGCVQAPRSSGRCLRCGAAMKHHRHGEPGQVWALLLSAAVFYVPANFLPIMEVRTLLGRSDHTILGGVIELWRYGSWDLAVIVFVASVLVPVTKLLALAFLLWRNRPVDAEVQRQRTRLYALVEFVGQWSMLDVFVVVLMAAMANFPGLSQISVGPAALNFGAVVVLTMWAAMRYDPRRGWDILRDARLAKEKHGH
ncbi:PqiA/YebS family transporter subunit [Castellaniella daejeonensis]|jgi:paraquat-inducible protein A|uniref:PqiA/YebS family transporter subunit n=1 Tax=Castellaniella daejeonensis TaxID=659013 RepID=A0ABN0TCU2_9BURK|nr:paraquat-inducible protein A [Castellaniella sp.]HET8703488.1 paraquat-inducible protein A [Castellaniella sp.]